MPGWIVSPLFSNSHMTAPQTNAAKTEKYLESGGIGLATPDADGGFEPARGMNDAITREQMYNTTLFRHPHVSPCLSLST